jgi:hypothetical protein
VTVSKFEKLNSVALRKFTSSDQATARQANLMLRKIRGPKFSQSHPDILLKIPIGVYSTGIPCCLLCILIFTRNLRSGFGLPSLHSRKGLVFA